MEVECFKIKLQPNSIPLVREWAARLNSQLDQVKELLKKEGMTLESVFLEQSLDGDYLIYYLRSPNLKKTREISMSSGHPIDVFHRDFMKKIFESSVNLECLLDVE